MTTLESFSASWSKTQLKAEEVIFLQKREFHIKSSLDIKMHDLEERKLL